MKKLEEIAQYWDERSRGYSEHNWEELDDENRIRWVNTIMRYAPEQERLSVLDIGCGPGFFSILMSQCGHQVTGVDYSEKMLAHACENAKARSQNVTFRRMDAQRLDFPDGTFDLIISRNVTWCMEEPVQAYQEWLRVLRKGGKIVNFDGNHYLHNFDPEFSNATVKERQKELDAHERYLHDVNPKMMDDIALELPLSKEKRPEWDFITLAALGAHKFDVELYDHIQVVKEGKKEFYAKSFVLSAQK
ncbi:MAG: class I SAM-dependent methyltransferase [Clostridiales bacterium]|jgi:SAM-dependent methyltransferase|nr:class I SAM-dependent methyltransferase [Clostridiales bacterium]